MKKISIVTKSLFIAALCGTIIGSESCSTIFNGSSQGVKITASETGTQVFVDGTATGTAPTTVKLRRGKSHVIEVKKQGYDTYRVTTDKSITGWFWGNLICGGLVGMVIDLATGNAYDVDPDIIAAQLNKTTAMIQSSDNQDVGYIFIKGNDGNLELAMQVVWE